VTDLQLTRQTRQQALEARFALRVTAALSERGVEHDIDQRLRVAREMALSRARHRVTLASQVQVVGHGTAVLGGSPWWLRMASMAPILVLALGLMLIERIDSQEQIEAAAEIDAILLADELPPRAYSDPGFGEFLRQPGP
jgi:Protein of unknown function (DUF3619)